MILNQGSDREKEKEKIDIWDISEVGLTQLDDLLLAKQEHEKVNEFAYTVRDTGVTN